MKRSIGILVLAGSALSCTENSPCPAGQKFEKGYCAPGQSAADGSASEMDAAKLDAFVSGDVALDSTSDAGAQGTDPGTPCTGQAECGGVASYCALQPGVPVGYCTPPGCDTMPDICPPGWTCFNVGMFKPGEPHICLRP